MSDQNTSTSVPAGSPIIINTTAPAPASAPSKIADDGGDQGFQKMSAKQFNQRLAEAEEAGAKKLLKELGINKADRKSALEEIREGRMALTKKEKEIMAAKAEAEALKPKAAKTDELENELKLYADEMFANLPESLQKYIAETVADSPAARLKAMRAARTAGLAPNFKDASKGEEAPKPANPSTTVAQPGPATPKPVGTLNHYETWKELQRQGRGAQAANYYMMYAKAIDKEWPR